jgi:coatomer subunit beta'
LNPRDINIFASASLDKTVKVWNINSKKVALYTLKGHTNGVNCVDYFRGDKPYLISGGDDRLVKIWDYQTKQCLHTLGL